MNRSTVNNTLERDRICAQAFHFVVTELLRRSTPAGVRTAEKEVRAAYAREVLEMATQKRIELEVSAALSSEAR